MGIMEATRTGLSASSGRSGACQRNMCMAPRVKTMVASKRRQRSQKRAAEKRGSMAQGTPVTSARKTFATQAADWYMGRQL